MTSTPFRPLGFTLIELMVTLAVIVVLSMLALPSFRSFQQRSALRGTSEEVLGFWNQARFEAAKRNELVKVGVERGSTGFCMGAATTQDPADNVPCSCLTGTDCNVAVFPKSQDEWRQVTFREVTGTPTLGSGSGVAVIEPKRGALAASDQAGVLSFQGPPGGNLYRVNLNVDAFGRGILCESTSASATMSDYSTRRCAP